MYFLVYDLTPTFIISPLQHSPGMSQDLKGLMIESASTISTYTIENPKLDDLVVFYKPDLSEIVLRVAAVRLQLTSSQTTESIYWYELDLETAPIKYDNINKLILGRNYVYDLVLEKNIELKKYKIYTQEVDKIRSYLEEFKKYYFPEKDYYKVHFNDTNYVFCELNELIYFIKSKYSGKFNRLFEEIKNSFGYWDRYSMIMDKELTGFIENKDFHFIDINTGETSVMYYEELPDEIHDIVDKMKELYQFFINFFKNQNLEYLTISK